MTEDKAFELPFRVGRKQGRAVLDAHGREVAVFPKGCQLMALEYVFMKNSQMFATNANKLADFVEMFNHWNPTQEEQLFFTNI